MTLTLDDLLTWLAIAGTALLAIGFIAGDIAAHHHDDNKKGRR